MQVNVTSGVAGAPMPQPSIKAANQARAHRAGVQFESMFMGEMLHQAHAKPQAVGIFRTGSGEDAMQPFLDQALGDALAARGGVGIAAAVERTLTQSTASRRGK